MSRKYRIFDTFTDALKKLETEDKELFRWPRNRIALSHALAQQLSKLNPDLSVDLCPYLKTSRKAINPDILAHNRKTGQKYLAIVCRNDYLPEADQKMLLSLAKEIKCELVMAISFFPQKNYMLLYRATENGIEYYHFDRNTLTSDIVRTKTTAEKQKDSQQLTLESM